MALTEQQALEGHDGRVWAVAWSPRGDMLASCSGDKTIRIWGRQTAGPPLSCMAILEDTHIKAVRSLSWSPCGTKIATASFDSKTAVWQLDGKDWEMVALLEGHENEVKSTAWSPDGALLATCSRDKSVWIWEAVDGRNEFECVDVKQVDGLSSQKHTQDVKHVQWHPTWPVPLLVSCSYDNSIMLWTDDGDADDWRCAQTLAKESGGHTSTVWQVAMQPQGERMASCSDDCTVKVWACSKLSGTQEPNWSHISTITGFHTRTVYSCDWSVDGLIVSGSGDNSIRIFKEDTEASLEPGQKRASYMQVACREDAHAGDVNSVRWNPKDSKLLASGGDDGIVRLWRLE